MTDTTQGQDAPPATAHADAPDVDDLFPKQDVDDLFPADYKPTSQMVRNVSPIQDMIFSDPGRSHARVLDAFGYGFRQDWGAGQQEFSEADDYLRKAGVYNDYAKGQRNIIKAANEAIMRPAVAAIVSAKSAFSGLFAGAQAAVAQEGEEVGAPGLGRELAALPEAFPRGVPETIGGVPHLPEPIAQARELNVIGSGEGGYFGTTPVEAELPQQTAEAAKVQDVAKPEALPGHDAEAGPSPIAPAVAAQPEAPAEAAPDIHTVARQIAPDTFQEFDALAQKKDTFRRWIDELREVRDENATANAPHADAIADLDAQITAQQAKKGGYGKLQSLIAKRDNLTAERGAYIADKTKGDSADMAKVRQQLMQTDYRQRDLAPDVSKAYRDAEARMPQAEDTQVPAETAGAAQPVPEGPEPVKPGHIRFYHGTSYEDASGFTGQTFVTPHYPYARDYHGGRGTAPDGSIIPNNVLYTDLSHAEADKRGLIDEVNRYPINGPINDGAAALKPMKPATPQAAATPAPETLIKGTAKASEAAGKQAIAPTELTQGQNEPEAAAAAKALPIAHAPSIVADVSQKLKAAGRPAEEADAAAQVVAAYWETRAQRFEGAKGSAAEMYAREAPEIVAGKEKISKKSRELELAQRDRSYNQEAPQTEAFQKWFGDSKIVDDATGKPAVVYHGTGAPIEQFEIERAGSNIDSGFLGKGIYLTTKPATADYYASVAGRRSGAESVVPLFASIQKPFHWGNKGQGARGLVFRGDRLPEEIHNAVIERSGFKFDPDAELSDTGPGDERRLADAIRSVLIERGYDGVIADVGGQKEIVAFHPEQLKSAIGNRGTFDPNSPKILHQGVQGRIRVRDGARATISLLKNADASTFIHETGHDWLERMLGDARDEAAPEALKNDARTVLKWLKIDSPDAVKTSHHEKFARGFETYMMEGRAPSTALARVFAKFKDWLTTIYKTVKALKSPISDDIRGVFDRLLAEKPEKTVIAPEREVKGGLGEKHEALVDATVPERAHEVANTIEGERDSQANRTLVKASDHDTRLSDTGTEAEGSAPRGAQSAGDADASGPLGAGSGESGGPGALGEGGSEAAPESAGTRAKSERLNTAPTPLLRFIASKGGIKASDELIKDLRQSLGGQNRLIPGYGQLIRQSKQLSSAARKAGRSEAMTIDRAREAAIEAGHLPQGASITDFLDAIDNEVRGIGHEVDRPHDPAEQAHAEHSFIEGLNDKVKEAGGAELSEAERARALELYKTEGLHDPNEIIERLALEADDGQIEDGAADRAPGIPGWDAPAPGWELSDDGRAASGEGEGTAPASAEQPGSRVARVGGKDENRNPLDATSDLPKSDTQLVDKAGNIRLDNLNAPEDVKAVIRATAVANDDFLTERRNVISDSTALKLADALGMDAGTLSIRKLGEAYNEEQIIAAANLLIKSAANVRDLAAKIAGGTDADVLAYAEANQRHLMIQGQFHGVTAEAGRALHAFKVLKKLQDLQGAKELGGAMKDLTGKTLYQMKEEGALLAMMGTPQQVSKAVHEANLTRWQKTRSGILSWFINNLISGPITHAGYSIGNTTVQLFKATVDTSVSAALDAVRGASPEQRVYFGEVGAQLYGMVRGMRDGYSPALTALKTGVPFMKGDVEGMLGQIEAAHRPQAIPGQLGYVMETPSRAVTAIHTMHYSMNYEAEIARRAFRSAMTDGLEPGSTAFNTKIADFTQSPPQAEMEAAHAEALKMVLMKSSQFGTAQYHLQKAVNGNILAKIVMPFMQVGANILHESFIERTPLGVMSPTVRDNLMGKNGEVARTTQASRIAVGIGISTAVVGLTAEGILTGGGPSDPKQLTIKEMTGWRPYSIKVGESYVPYRKYLGGMGPLIAGTADIYEVGHALSDEGLTKAAASSLFGFAEVIADESWAKGLSNFIDAARHWDRDGGRYLRNLSADFIPFSVGLSQITGLTDPYRREVRSMLDVARNHIPGLSRGLFPVRDIWGEPIESHTALGPSTANHDPATQALLDAGYYPGKLERKIRGVDLSDQQYDDFTRIGGRMSRMRMNALVNTPGFAQMPKQIQADKIKDIITNAREGARSMILMQNPDIITKANAAKLTKLKGEPVH